MRNKDYQKILDSYQEIMDNQVKRIETLRAENVRLLDEIEKLKENKPKSPENLFSETLMRLKQELLLALRTLDCLCPKLVEEMQLPQNDYYLELARLSSNDNTAASLASSNIMDEKELDSLIRYLGGVDTDIIC